MTLPASLHGIDEIEKYPLANLLGTKLRECFTKHQREQTASFVFGASDAVMANEYVENGADTLFVSGATSSLTETAPNHNCGADLSDYTYDTIPGRVKSVVQSQIHWARVDKVRGITRYDRLLPVIADGDSGHGSATATMKMVRLFLEAGCAGFHIDDLVQGEKMFEQGMSHSHVVVGWGEAARRLLAAKLQMDICQSTAVLIGRTDAETSTRITSTIDPHDRPFILGATCPEAGSLVSTIDCSFVGTEALAEEQKWEERAVLKTLDEAARNATWPSPQEYHKWTLESGKMNSSDAVALARQRGANIQWDADACRNHRGWYRFKGGSEAAIARGLLLAPLCDVVFPCVWGVDLEAIERFAATILQHYPGKWLGLNWSVPPQGMPTEEVATLVTRAASWGYVWQCSPMIGLIAEASALRCLHARAREVGLLAVCETVDRARAEGQNVVGWYNAAGAYSDEIMCTLARPSE